MATAPVTNLAWQAKWHRSTAADLKSVGLHAKAAERLEKARLCEAQIANSACSECNRPLKDPVSIELGIGPECRKKAVAV